MAAMLNITDGALSTVRNLPRLLTPSFVLLAGVLLFGCKSTTAPGPAAVTRAAVVIPNAHLDFNQDVQPILASNCFSCHGPDPEMRKAGLRLDLEETAFRKRPGHPDAIVPGHPELSELIRRVESNDHHVLMPQSPQGDAKPMKPEDIAVLKEWVKEGAQYRPHWAFEKPAKAPVPTAQNANWAKNPIDDFLLANLKKAGLKPSPEADKETLIRRVTLDLTGLLPTPGETKAFVADGSPQAYEHLVDGLLNRQSFGEDRARYWLDYARYADTYGLHHDNSRHAWPYRDYVIRSFNSNKPFDQFAMEQIAGDLMPAKNLDPLIASGYVRNGVSSSEGGAIPEEMRVNTARERTEAYGAVFLGLTVGCAVCHDHKYDPTTQKDFYSLSAFFNNIDEEPFNGDMPHWAPTVRIPTEQNRDLYDKVLAQRSQLAQQLAILQTQQSALLHRWLNSGIDLPQPVPSDNLQLRLKLDEGGGEVLHNSAPNAKPAVFPIGQFKPVWGETTWLWPDFRMDTNTKINLGRTGDYDWNQAFSAGGWIMFRSAPFYGLARTVGTLMSKADSGQHDRGWDLSVDHGRLVVELISEQPKQPERSTKSDPKDKSEPATFQFPTPLGLDQTDKAVVKQLKPAEKPKPAEAKKTDPKSPVDDTPEHAIKVTTIYSPPVDGTWDHVFFTYDGSGRASGVKIYVDGREAATKVIADTLGGSTIRTDAPMEIGRKYPDNDPSRETRYQDIRLYNRALTAEEIKRLPFEDVVSQITRHPRSQWTLDQQHIVSEFYVNSVDVTAKSIREQLAVLDAKLDQLSAGGEISIVSWEKPSLAYADILTRGVYSARTERVAADTPHFLPRLPTGIPHNRLALARWTVSPENPLTARVTVNRMWNEVFGTGLVETTEDFGIMGQRPSNPQLLDWLAVEFRESGWNIKHMYKLMVMSAAYRQSARSTPEQLAKDPKNLLLAHGPRFRMDAEMLRDIALQSSGLLVNKVGGPSVKGYQPPNMWENIGIDKSDTLVYTQDHGSALYRRSMYTYWKRMSLMPDMETFDAPVRDTACTRRQRTDTPLQALVTLNDVQWVEAARALAQRVIVQGGKEPEDRIRLMSEILLAHDPPPQMTTTLERSLVKMEDHYSKDPRAAKQLIHEGESSAKPGIPAPELAAWTMVASEMLNLDETITK